MFGKVSKLSFFPSSILDCKNLRGKCAFGGMGLERIEFGTTLPELGGGGARVAAALGLEMIGCCSKTSSKLAVVEFSSSYLDNSSLSTSRLWSDTLKSPATSIPLLKLIASTISKSPIELTIVELESLHCSQICPMNFAICPS
ncbi:hypothetical protein ACFX1X_023049 [Malus domestica]